MKCCWFCGDTEDLTNHHAKHIRGKRVKAGIIILCRDCHTWVHNIDKAIKACKRGQMNEKVFLRTVTAFAENTELKGK